MLFSAEIIQLRRDLLMWFAEHRRDLPWRRTSDPYAIWISEIMLQQTRVAAVIPYFQRFLARFPNFQELAAASEPELLTHWAGLGYYYRARNLQRAAQRMLESGSFPKTVDDLRRLPGVGHYTAAAVASIGFNVPQAVLDGNVFRVLSRVFDDRTDIASSAGRKHFSALAGEILDREQPGSFNQAMMELGATICLPKNPQCPVCPVSTLCRARAGGTQSELPVKIVARKSVREERTLFWIERGGKLLVWQRPPESRLMPGFWELPERSQLPNAAVGSTLGFFRHGITFHNYRFEVKQCAAPSDLVSCQWIGMEELAALPVSTIFKKARRVVEAGHRKGQLARSAAAPG